MALFNSSIVMALVYIYNYSIPIIIDRKKRTVLSNEELICLSILCAIVISGLSDMFIYGVSIKIVLSVFTVILISYSQGAGVGAAIGTTVGLITCISSQQVPVIIGTYAFCGLLAGIFRDMGRIGTAMGFIMADAVILFYLNGASSVIGLKELAAGIFIFMVFPSSIIEKGMRFVDASARSLIGQQSYVEKIKDIINGKIMRMTDVFSELSVTLSENDTNDKLRQSSEVNSIINSVVDKICSECDARNICWNRDFYGTYQNMFELIDVIQTDGKVDMESVPGDLKKKCLKVNQLIKTSNYMFDIYRMNYKWRRKAQEGKKVVSEQLEGLAGVLKGLSEEISQEIHFEGAIEEEVAIALDKEGIEFNDIAIVKDKNGKYEVNMYKRACLGRRECIKDVSPIISKALKKRMKRDSASCVMKEGTNLCCFKLVEAVKFQVSTGISKEIKDKGGLSGDNYSFLELDNGKYMMALSDGMGTGPAAAAESNAAITLLEKYLEAGFDKSTVLKAINSTMALKSPDDNFATIDLAVADLYTGEVEIIKIGSASTFIKRTNGSVESISSTTLPMGILNSVDIELKKFKLSHGDFLIMVTDGVQESGSNEGSCDWMIRALEEIDSRNPQQVAEDLLSKARERNNSQIVDDMTVLVSKMWEVL
jgi:stage II sporulation protein E